MNGHVFVCPRALKYTQTYLACTSLSSARRNPDQNRMDGGGEVTDPFSGPNEESPMKYQYPAFLAQKEHISRWLLPRFLRCAGVDNPYQGSWAERGLI